MALRRRSAEDLELARLYRAKRGEQEVGQPLGQEMVTFFKRSVQKRQTKFAKIAEVWGRLVPETFSEHCALQSFQRGTLTVMVDNASHLYELKQLLLAGLEQQLVLACRFASLRKVSLKFGRWYDGEDDRDRRPRFS